MFSRQMNLMSLYSAEVPWIRKKKPSSLTITGIENRDDIRSMLVDLLRVSMCCARMSACNHNMADISKSSRRLNWDVKSLDSSSVTQSHPAIIIIIIIIYNIII